MSPEEICTYLSDRFKKTNLTSLFDEESYNKDPFIFSDIEENYTYHRLIQLSNEYFITRKERIKNTADSSYDIILVKPNFTIGEKDETTSIKHLLPIAFQNIQFLQGCIISKANEKVTFLLTSQVGSPHKFLLGNLIYNLSDKTINFNLIPHNIPPTNFSQYSLSQYDDGAPVITFQDASHKITNLTYSFGGTFTIYDDTPHSAPTPLDGLYRSYSENNTLYFFYRNLFQAGTIQVCTNTDPYIRIEHNSVSSILFRLGGTVIIYDVSDCKTSQFFLARPLNYMSSIAEIKSFISLRSGAKRRVLLK